ncbi:unnamed protein product [Haemonchus placei]|uniref:Uncharacterized protein n=1 Tax=Haemonchus placei TaxID=6290 RepID=A0A0N4X803_HAEPC|nr:unnamed protein product [Haemonchus placei]
MTNRIDDQCRLTELGGQGPCACYGSDDDNAEEHRSPCMRWSPMNNSFLYDFL